MSFWSAIFGNGKKPESESSPTGQSVHLGSLHIENMVNYPGATVRIVDGDLDISSNLPPFIPYVNLDPFAGQVIGAISMGTIPPENTINIVFDENPQHIDTMNIGPGAVVNIARNINEKRNLNK